jgi:DNA-binding MarR family transcriptional regulator
VNPAPFLQLDRVIHEKGRLVILSLLAASPHLGFTEIRGALAMTDGTLSMHIRTLQEAGYVAVTKAFLGGRSQTTYTLTPAGRTAFAAYLNLLEEILRQNKPKK